MVSGSAGLPTVDQYCIANHLVCRFFACCQALQWRRSSTSHRDCRGVSTCNLVPRAFSEARGFEARLC